MIRLHINIDHVATLRQARLTDEPDPVRAAVLCEMGGADGITVHLREDRRHIQERDLRLLMETVRTGVNLELSTAGDLVALACELRPMAATLVPERREELTTEGGLRLTGSGQKSRVEKAATALRDAGIRTCLFMDPDPDAIRAAADLAIHAVEIHTGEYSRAFRRSFDAETGSAGSETDTRRGALELDRIRRAAVLARSLGLDVHAGHGLTYENVMPVAGIREVEELNIGHSIVSRSIFTGIQEAVSEMKRLMIIARQGENPSGR